MQERLRTDPVAQEMVRLKNAEIKSYCPIALTMETIQELIAEEAANPRYDKAQCSHNLSNNVGKNILASSDCESYPTNDPAVDADGGGAPDEDCDAPRKGSSAPRDGGVR